MSIDTTKLMFFTVSLDIQFWNQGMQYCNECDDFDLQAALRTQQMLGQAHQALSLETTYNERAQ